MRSSHLFSGVKLKILFLVLLSLSLTACATNKDNTQSSIGNNIRYGSFDEIALPPDLPDDDGAPLSPMERKVLESSSALGQPINTDDWKDVVLHFKYFSRKKRDSFERILHRGELWIPHIKKIFRDNNIPEEITNLAIVESAFNPNAVSRAGATGVWQFMPYTGAKYGLTQNSWIDERRDTIKATQAAADYLNKLFDDFGTWHLAMAAYNAGEGKISRAINGVGSAETFFDLSRKNHMLNDKMQLKDETRQYVPRFIAVNKIMQNLTALGFKEPNPEWALQIEAVELKPGTDLVGLARSVGMSWDEFSALNPAFRRQTSHPRDTNTAYVRPKQKEAALAFLERQDSRSLAGWKDYTAKKGDTLMSLSKKFQVPVAILKKVNQGAVDDIKAGSIVMVPGSREALRNTVDTTPALDSEVEARLNKSGKPAKAKGKEKTNLLLAEANKSGLFHTVSAGETLFSLSRSWGSSPAEVRKLNKLRDDEPIRIGQRLSIPGGVSPSKIETNFEPKKDKAAKESAIAAKAKPQIKPEPKAEPKPAPEKANASPKVEKPSQKAGGAESSASGKVKLHTVQSGDTFYKLARESNSTVEEIYKANGFNSSSALKLGTIIKLPAKK